MKRIELLDLCRSLLVAFMVVWHALYDLALFGLTDHTFVESTAYHVSACLCGGGFILIAGICCRFSRDNLRRGLIVLAAGVAVMAVSLWVGNPVLFGILQLLGISMLLYGLFGRRLERLPPYVLPIACAVLFPLTLWWTKSTVVDITWVFPFGFVTDTFYSSDYYPLLPWIFLFLFGTWFGGLLKNKSSRRKIPPALTWPGRHSLLIYLLHQPVIYCMVYIISRIQC